MTAHALSGARERCLEAGMDGYLSKPIVPQRLFDTIEHAASGSATAEAAAPAPGPAVDQVRALALVDGDRQLLAEVVRLSMRAWPAKLRAVQRAVTKGDASALYAAAHALKGSAASFAADGVASLAGQLEAMARTSNLAGALALSRQLERAVKRLPAQLRPWGLALGPSSRTAARPARGRPRAR
jgi:CheY-like chemotaxis protein